MQRKRQKTCLLASLSLLTVLSTYYIATSPVELLTSNRDHPKENLEITLKEVSPEQKNANEAQDEQTSGSNYFLVHLLQRNTSRSKSQEECMKTMSDPNATQEETQRATKNMDELNKIATREDGLENLIRNKGYQDVVVDTTNGHVEVTVQSKKLSCKQVDELLTLVKEELKVDVTNISIRNRV